MTALPAPRREPEDEQAEQQRRERLIKLLQSWREAEGEEAQEQIDTYNFLEKALNEDRLSYRKRL